MSRTKARISEEAGLANDLKTLLELLAPDRAPRLQPYGHSTDTRQTCLLQAPDEERQNLQPALQRE